MTTATAPAPISRPAAQPAAFAGCPAPAWVPSHAVDVLCDAAADARKGIPQPERICRDDADRAAYARYYEAALKAFRVCGSPTK